MESWDYLGHGVLSCGICGERMETNQRCYPFDCECWHHLDCLKRLMKEDELVDCPTCGDPINEWDMAMLTRA
ncbi:hypothetical protein AVEN_237932-1 [Araneus ventricosus]|uniref:RING-type domain-containing protein n=1 Tax=Araneus ventricosus TaxID=182803 RepID=A0A4Y2VB42_ARAVE|nr:hypothetical protein AVEN_237932-1 [Araneus ventricosus]